ncbi:HPr kinase/phosphatase C-terminal domain-containing protein [Phaeobacter sp. QD34_3]|uniref:HPr kinase/phosphorylase n=1 Tax=unclassified Phaeobacter TaxID=2621772 RepID=UPI00237F9FEE|nr:MULTISPECIES: HPr kinase/phosphatase C-terminal domain-containing protein [unclassified Phaeobacter]MDE4132905.1 HPr kinase/phosphatase C-terminal domain-containing protein [Phaeobacter sp. QD34_3]MDE4136693.1 HPr kinase/phosphatase C-terminal domain-containing protein [Phaeobacter sp. QD34_24]
MTQPDAMPKPDTNQSDTGQSESCLCLHASCVALEGRALLIRGAAGRGKSALCLQLMAYGAQLVADDRVLLRVDGADLVASAPEATKGLIEARGLGILRAQSAAEARVVAIVDMDRVEGDRLPVQICEEILGRTLPVLKRVDAAHFAPALMQYLKCGALAPDA